MFDENGQFFVFDPCEEDPHGKGMDVGQVTKAKEKHSIQGGGLGLALGWSRDYYWSTGECRLTMASEKYKDWNIPYGHTYIFRSSTVKEFKPTTVPKRSLHEQERQGRLRGAP